MSPEHPLLAAARRLAPAVAAAAPAAHAERRVPRALVDAFVAAGFYRMLAPADVGGGEVSPRVFVGVLEELARADGSAAWCVMVGATTGLVAALVPLEVARTTFPPEAVAAGVFAPLGMATPEPGGLRVSGRWPFASGAEHATVRLAGVTIRREGAAPEVRHVLLDPAAMRIVDTWDTAGLRGTGSHDMVAEDVWVDEARTLSLFDARPRVGAPVYAFPFFGLLSLGVAAVTLGLARGALDAFADLAGRKAPAGGRRTLNQRETIQLRFAEASAELAAARAFVLAAIEEAEAEATRGAVSPGGRAHLRLAAAHAARASAAVVDRVYHAAGGSSIYGGHPLQRAFQDVHVATQHAMVGEPVWGLCGRVLLGVEAELGQL